MKNNYDDKEAIKLIAAYRNAAYDVGYKYALWINGHPCVSNEDVLNYKNELEEIQRNIYDFLDIPVI